MRRTIIKVMAGLVVLTLCGLAAAANWAVFKSDKFGFAMLVPPGTQWAAKDYGKGWGGIHTKTGITEFVGIAKLKEYASPAELEASAVLLTGVPAKAWKKVGEGTNRNGWKWFRTYEATGNGKVLLTVLGTGPKGSYVLFLGTTAADVAANKPLYLKWYDSLTVF
jgi:hypothetical protein